MGRGEFGGGGVVLTSIHRQRGWGNRGESRGWMIGGRCDMGVGVENLEGEGLY